MSASYPSNRSWEPYGSSQQEHALGWRRSATRAAAPLLPSASLPSPTPPLSSHLPAAARWNQLHRPRRDTLAALGTQPKSSDTPSMLPGEITPAAAASFRQHESDTRVLARYDVVRGDIRAVRKDVEKLVEQVKEGVERGEKRDDGLERDLARLQGVCTSLRDDVREGTRENDDDLEKEKRDESLERDLARLLGVCNGLRDDIREGKKERDDDLDRVKSERGKRERDERRRWEKHVQRVEKLVDHCVEKRVREMGSRIEQRVKEMGNRMESSVMEGMEKVMDGRFGEVTKVVREAVAEIVNASAARNDKPDGTLPERDAEQEARGARPARGDAERPETPQSDDMYALQIANRPRPTAVQDFSNPTDGDLFRRVESQNEIEPQRVGQRDQEAGGTCPASSGTNFFEEDKTAFSCSPSTAATVWTDPNFRLENSSSDSASLLGPFNRVSRRPRKAPKPRKAQSNGKARTKGNSRTTLAARSNLSKRPAAKRAPLTRSRAAVGTKRSRYPA